MALIQMSTRTKMKKMNKRCWDKHCHKLKLHTLQNLIALKRKRFRKELENT